LTASPMISKRRIIASCKCRLLKNSAWDTPSAYSSIRRIERQLGVTLGPSGPSQASYLMIRGKKLTAPYGRRISLLSGGSSSIYYVLYENLRSFFTV
jgi:hypothetical protein